MEYMSTQTFSESTRESAVKIVQRAYADGRINEPELEHRLSLIFEATSYPQLRLALADLPAPTPVQVPSAFRTATPTAARSSFDMASLVHFSGLVSGPIGPGVAWLATKGNPSLNRETAKALNFQLLAMAGFIASGVLGLIGLRFLIPLWPITWASLTIISTVKASRGEDWQNPLTQITGFRPVGDSKA